MINKRLNLIICQSQHLPFWAFPYSHLDEFQVGSKWISYLYTMFVVAVTINLNTYQLSIWFIVMIVVSKFKLGFSLKLLLVMRFMQWFNFCNQNSATDIHCCLCQVYSNNIMSDSVSGIGTQRWMTKKGKKHHSIVINELIRKVEQTICKNHCFTISKFSDDFSQIETRATLNGFVPHKLLLSKVGG